MTAVVELGHTLSCPPSSLLLAQLCSFMAHCLVASGHGIKGEPPYPQWIALIKVSFSTFLIALSMAVAPLSLSLIHISEPTRQEAISYAVFCV